MTQIPDPQAARLVQTFCEELCNQGNSGTFLEELDGVLKHKSEEPERTANWNEILTVWYHRIAPILDPAAFVRADRLWQQARVMIGEVMERRQLAEMLRIRQRERFLRRIGADLITTFDVEQLLDILAEDLPLLGISSGYLALYDKGASTSESG